MIKTNAYAIKRVLPSRGKRVALKFSHKIILRGGAGQNLDSWREATELGNTYNYQGQQQKKGWNLGGRCAIVYANGDFPFKVLVNAVDILSCMYREVGRI